MTRGPGPAPSWLGFVFVALGLIPIGTALFADDTGFNAPRWVVFIVGGLFALAGLAVLAPGGALRLARFNVPTRVVFVEALPKTPTAEVQKDRLRAELGSPA